MPLLVNLLAAVLLAPLDGPEPIVVPVPIDAAGNVDINEAVARLAARAGLVIQRPPNPLKLPTRGLAGALTLTLLREALGSDVNLDVGPKTLQITIDPELLTADGLARWSRRLDDLADRAARAVRLSARFGMRARPSYRPNDPDRPTVCLIHGLNSTSDSFRHMIPVLEQAGFGVVTYDYPQSQALDRSAAEFSRDWAAFRRKSGDRRPWAIVAHSMGALIARSYVEGDDYARDVDDLVLIAPPNHGSAIAGAQVLLELIRGMQAVRGTRVASLVDLSRGLGASADDLKPGSRFLRALNARSRRAGVAYHILAGDGGPLTPETRRTIAARVAAIETQGGLLGGLTRLAFADLDDALDDLTLGIGDGCVSVASTRLDGVTDHETIHANHVELIRGPSLFADAGPVACMPCILKWLKPAVAAQH